MDRGAWQTTIHGVARVGYDLVTRSDHPTETSNLFPIVFHFLESHLNGIIWHAHFKNVASFT